MLGSVIFQNFADLLRSHRESGADVTMATVSVDLEQAVKSGVVKVLPGGKLLLTYVKLPRDSVRTTEIPGCLHLLLSSVASYCGQRQYSAVISLEGSAGVQ